MNEKDALDKSKIKEIDPHLMSQQVLNKMQMTFLSYRNILSKNQYTVLKAIAKESSVKTVRSKDFTTS